MAVDINMPLSEIINHELPSKHYGVNDGGFYFVNGDSKLVELSFGVAKLYKEVFHTLYPQFREYLVMEGITEPSDAYHIKLFFGVTNIGDNFAAANYYIPLKDQYTSRLFNMILMKEDVYKNIVTKNRGLASLYMLHEMCHSIYHLDESKTYSLIAKFYHHLENISSGAAKKEYHGLAKIADMLHEAYKKNPYEARSLALNYVNAELSKAGISKEYRSYLLDMKSYLARKATGKEQNNSKGKKPDSKKGDETKKNDTKTSASSSKQAKSSSKSASSGKSSSSAKK